MAFCGGNSNNLVRDCRSHYKELVNPWLKNMGSLLLVNRQIGAEVSDFLHRKRTAKFCIFSELGTSYDIPDFLAFRKVHLDIWITYNQYCIKYGRKGQGIGASLSRWADELVKHYQRYEPSGQKTIRLEFSNSRCLSGWNDKELRACAYWWNLIWQRTQLRHAVESMREDLKARLPSSAVVVTTNVEEDQNLEIEVVRESAD